MQEAIRLSCEAVTDGLGGPFGAVVVRGEQIIGRGRNMVTSLNDPTAHAEVIAIRNACRSLDSFKLAGCTLYTSCEPCPMCQAAVCWARIDRVVYANTRDDAAEIGFDDALIFDELTGNAVTKRVRFEQCLREEAQAAFDLWTAKSDKIPY